MMEVVVKVLKTIPGDNKTMEACAVAIKKMLDDGYAISGYSTSSLGSIIYNSIIFTKP